MLLKYHFLEVHDIILVLKSFIGDFFFYFWHSLLDGQLLSISGRKDFNLIIRQVSVSCACPCCCRALCARYYLDLKQIFDNSKIINLSVLYTLYCKGWSFFYIRLLITLIGIFKLSLIVVKVLVRIIYILAVIHLLEDVMKRNLKVFVKRGIL